MSLVNIILLCMVGCFSGFMAGLLGIGGGLILTPFLTMLIPDTIVPREYIVHVAIATSLATIAFTSISSVRAHHKRKAVLWNVVATVGCGVLIGALIGTQIAGYMSKFWLALLFSCFVGFSAYNMFKNKQPKPTRNLPGPAGKIGMGVLIGTLASLIGAGGGFISVPWMVWCNVKMHNAVATSAGIGVPIAVFGTIGYIISGWNVHDGPGFPIMLGYICLPALLATAATSILFAPIGAKLAHSIDTKPLKKIFACLMCVLGCYMLYQAWLVRPF